MLEEKEPINEPVEEEVGTEKEGLKFTEKDVEKVKEAIAEEVINHSGISKEESEAYNKILEAATMPVELLDSLFKLGDQELDIRKLCKKNKDQMFFRQQTLEIVYLKAISQSLVDVIRLLMIIADKLGVENIIQATDDIIEKQREQHEELKNLGKNKEPQA